MTQHIAHTNMVKQQIRTWGVTEAHLVEQLTNIPRELFDRGDAVAVLPYDPIQDVVVLIEQFRIGAMRNQHSPWLIECVAGMIDADDEGPEQVIHRETQEEIGLSLGRVKPLFDYWVSPGGCSERMALFCGEVHAEAAPAYAGNSHEHEDIRVHVVPVQTAFASLQLGAIDNATTIIALQWLQLNHEQLRAEWSK